MRLLTNVPDAPMVVCKLAAAEPAVGGAVAHLERAVGDVDVASPAHGALDDHRAPAVHDEVNGDAAGQTAAQRVSVGGRVVESNRGGGYAVGNDGVVVGDIPEEFTLSPTM